VVRFAAAIGTVKTNAGLDFYECVLSDEVLRGVAALSLCAISLNGCAIRGDVGARVFIEALDPTITEEIVIVVCGVSDGTCVAIEETFRAKKFAVLEKIDLRQNRITDDGFIALARALSFVARTIKNLYIEEQAQPVTWRGIEAVLAAVAETYADQFNLNLRIRGRLQGVPPGVNVNTQMREAIKAAHERFLHPRRLTTFLGATNSVLRTPTRYFVWHDGDRAMAWRVMQFLG
jgi:hypothetical protein